MITGLNHVNLRAPAALLDTLRDFYRDVLGLEVGMRPHGFSSGGYWLYAGDQAIVHLSRQRDAEPPRRVLEGTTPYTLDHVAFSASDPERMATSLQRHGVRFREERSPDTRQHQFFLTDPAGNGVEFNFPWIDLDAR